MTKPSPPVSTVVDAVDAGFEAVKANRPLGEVVEAIGRETVELNLERALVDPWFCRVVLRYLQTAHAKQSQAWVPSSWDGSLCGQVVSGGLSVLSDELLLGALLSLPVLRQLRQAVTSYSLLDDTSAERGVVHWKVIAVERAYAALERDAPGLIPSDEDLDKMLEEIVSRLKPE